MKDSLDSRAILVLINVLRKCAVLPSDILLPKFSIAPSEASPLQAIALNRLE